MKQKKKHLFHGVHGGPCWVSARPVLVLLVLLVPTLDVHDMIMIHVIDVIHVIFQKRLQMLHPLFFFVCTLLPQRLQTS